jgi:glycosyltransferase involved in cell wall biosynthesis
MRICIFGGADSIHVQRWCQYFCENHHEVHLVDFLDEHEQRKGDHDLGDVEFHGIRTSFSDGPASKLVHDIRNKMTANEFKYSKYTEIIRDIVRKIEPDIIHGHYVSKHGFWAAKADFRPLVLSAWGSDIAHPSIDAKQLKIIKFSLDNADMVHTGDEYGKKRLIQLGCMDKNIFIQPWGVNVERFSSSARSDSIRARILGGADGFIVTIVYALEDQYNISELVSAVPSIIEKVDNVKFQIIGEGAGREKLESLVDDLYLNESVIFMGKVPHSEIHQHLASSDIYVDTYYSDVGGGGIGVAVMEAMACGLPIVAARRPGVENGVFKGENGFLYESGHSEELADKLLHLINNRDKMKTFGLKSRELAEKVGDWNKNMKEFETIYKRLSNAK